MYRRSILLAASPQDNPIPGVYNDLSAFYSFLRSNHGGAWDDTEIFRGENSTRDQILSAINAAKNAEYSLVFFAGHGEPVKMDLPWAETRMMLGSGETITERELNSGSLRCTLILDCCRRKPKQAEQTFLIDTSAFCEHGTDASGFRSLYDERLADAESGLVKVYNPTLATHSLTQHILNAANTWSTRNKGVLYLGHAVTLARDSMREENQKQLAEYQCGRRLRHFPFAVQI